MLLEIRHVSVRIDDTPILHDVSLSLGAGEIYGLLGPNGAGKTTTIAAALGLLPRLGGEIRVLGHDPQGGGPDLRRRVGVLPDPNGFYDWMTAGDYLAFFAGLYGRNLAAEEIADRVGDRIGRVGLVPRPGQPIGTFSRGMRQRLGLARALVANPELLVLDEPTSGLDPSGRREIHDILVDLASEGVGILLCTHLLDDVERLCTRIGFIVEGRTVAEGGIGELLRTRDHQPSFRLRLARPVPSGAELPNHTTLVARQGEWVFVEVDAATAPEVAWRELLFLGWPIVEIAREGGGLEDLYLDLVSTHQTAPLNPPESIAA
jgi:ABC-2 type transport system ATP-binding protein